MFVVVISAGTSEDLARFSLVCVCLAGTSEDRAKSIVAGTIEDLATGCVIFVVFPCDGTASEAFSLLMVNVSSYHTSSPFPWALLWWLLQRFL